MKKLLTCVVVAGIMGLSGCSTTYYVEPMSTYQNMCFSVGFYKSYGKDGATTLMEAQDEAGYDSDTCLSYLTDGFKQGEGVQSVVLTNDTYSEPVNWSEFGRFIGSVLVVMGEVASQQAESDREQFEQFQESISRQNEIHNGVVSALQSMGY